MNEQIALLWHSQVANPQAAQTLRLENVTILLNIASFFCLKHRQQLRLIKVSEKISA
jgi:hypothetical protein